MRLRIVTWNLHGGIGLDGVLDVERIARELADLEPDVVGLLLAGPACRVDHSRALTADIATIPFACSQQDPA